jgi:transposase
MGNTIQLTKEQLQQLSKDEIIEIVIQLVAEVNALTQRVAELEERINQNSSNSSQPPSSDKPWKLKPKSLRQPTERKPGGQFGHKGHGKKIPHEINETVKVEPKICPCCGGDLHEVSGKKAETRYQSDIPEIKVVTTAYEVYEKTCPHCGEVVSGTFPATVTSTFQYGPHVKAFIVMLSHYGMVAMNKIKDLLKSLFDIHLSEGTIVSAIKNCAGKFESAQGAIKAAVVNEKVVHFDETGMSNNGILWWLHRASTKCLTYLKIHKKRGREAIDATGILGAFKGVAVHDCLKVYWVYVCLHALCNAHLLRELIGILENTGQEWTKAMIELLVDMKETVYLHKERGLKTLPDDSQLKFEARYNKLVEDGLELNPYVEKDTVKQGVAKQSKARRLLERLRDHKDEYLLFTKDFDVPFDNNQAERDFRIAKTKKKVSGGFRSDAGAESFAMIQSIIQTIRKHNINVFYELVKVFHGNYSLPFALVSTE